jgi:lysozyme
MSRTISDAGLDFIVEREGCVLHPYLDVAGRATIGVGHLIRSNEHFTTITEAQARALLVEDAAFAEAAINSWVHVELTQNQFDALVSFVFNEGTANFHTSTILRDLNAGHFDRAPADLLMWDKAHVDGKLVEVDGLRQRRLLEGELFRSRSA